MSIRSIYLLVLILITSCQMHEVSIPNYTFSNCDFLAVGHRGYSDIYPENTLLSIEEAFKRGVKYCEIDVSVTSDDVYVLFHDQPTMYRTSNGKGYIVSSTYEELQNLDFGSWKGSQFKNTKIATLEEALLLAEKYDGYYYLDTKDFRIDLMAKALKQTKVNPKRLLPAISNIDEAKEFKKYCPESSFVYFGGMPEDITNDDWYKELIALGCVFFETYYTAAIDNTPQFQTFAKKVHEHGAKLWVFTSNNIDEIKTMIGNGVDGVESDVAISAMKTICYNDSINIGPIKVTTGNWNFNQGNFASTGVGSQFRPLNYASMDNSQLVQFGTTTTFGIKSIDNVEAKIAKIPAFNPDEGLFLFTNFAPDSNEDLHYNYTLLMDVYIPKNSESSIISVFQTSPTNQNDADFFIKSGALGINNEYHGNLQSETWHRLAIVVSKYRIKKYLNGKIVGENDISGGRWSVYNSFPGGQDQGFLLFADDDNETGELFINAIQLRNYSMTDSEIANLGVVKPNGIAISNSGIYNLKFENEIKPSIVNWDTNEIYVFLSKKNKISKVKIDFDIPLGANSNLKTGARLNFKRGKSTMIEITAQDNNSKTSWTIIPIIE